MSPDSGVPSPSHHRGFKILSGTANRPLAEEVARSLGTELCKVTCTRFADGEVFVRIDESMVDGFVPRRTLPGGGFSTRMSHGGSRRGAKGKGGKGTKGTKDYETGDRVSCRIVEADGVRGSLILEILDHEAAPRRVKSEE
jgi:exoribonuclease R